MNGILRAFGSIVFAALAYVPAIAHDHPEHKASEKMIHARSLTEPEGKPAIAMGATGTVMLSVRDENKTATPCRVNVIGSDGNFYEPDVNPLSPWSLHRLGNRLGKGPFRYYGWFFYCDGKTAVRVPPGPVTIEVWKGYEYRPSVVKLDIQQDQQKEVVIALDRVASMLPHGYYSGDTHLHLDRQSETDDQRAFDLLQAEGIDYGYVLCMNDPRTYTGTMARQQWQQSLGIGPESVRNRDTTFLMSGQEYRCAAFGHICLLGHRKLVLENDTVDPNNWPVFGKVGRMVAEQGGFSFHAHGGYEMEIYADYVRPDTTGVELLQFAEYRGISLQGWYHILNAGSAFPAVGASDYPYCRAFGDCRTYVQADKRPDPQEWLTLAAQGRGFFTTGPLLLFEVDNHLPGDTIQKQAGPVTVRAKLRYRSEVSTIDVVEFIVNGTVAHRATATQSSDWNTLETDLHLGEPSWIAARVYSKTKFDDLHDSEAHTNPVYVQIAGKKPYNADSIRWLLQKLDGRIVFHQRRQFPEKEMVLRYLTETRNLLRQRLARQ